MTVLVSFAEKPALTGELVILRPVHDRDAAGLAYVDAETLRLTGSYQRFDLEELRGW